MGTVLKFFKITNNELAIFNEYNFIDSLQLNEVVKRSNAKTRIPKELNFSKFKRISENTEMQIQIGGGIRNVDYAKKISEIVNKVVIGTVAINNRKLFDSYKKFFNT